VQVIDLQSHINVMVVPIGAIYWSIKV